MLKKRYFWCFPEKNLLALEVESSSYSKLPCSDFPEIAEFCGFFFLVLLVCKKWQISDFSQSIYLNITIIALYLISILLLFIKVKSIFIDLGVFNIYIFFFLVETTEQMECSGDIELEDNRWELDIRILMSFGWIVLQIVNCNLICTVAALIPLLQ